MSCRGQRSEVSNQKAAPAARFLIADIRLLIPGGAIAQLGERLNGIQEVGGSTPPGSTK
jgi:hypothetical protein